MPVLRYPVFIVFLFFAGCVHLITPPPVEEARPPTPKTISHEFFEEGKRVTIHIPHGAIAIEETVNNLLRSSSDSIGYGRYFSHVTHDSLRRVLTGQLRERATGDTLLVYTLEEITSDGATISLTFEEDRQRLTLVAGKLLRESVQVSGRDDFSYLVGHSFLLPCASVPVPTEANLLPNAPRTYRSGIHRGIDFPAKYGARVRSIAHGVVIRADHGYREVTPEFRESLLKAASYLGHTPSDVFEHILLGRSVFIDHGMDRSPGKRLVSAYTHLSEIDEKIQVGSSVERGEVLGFVGNSGTGDGARGTKNGAHLHFELMVQDENGDRYMGQGLDYPELANLLSTIFAEE